jgi:hypothetical protein
MPSRRNWLPPEKIGALIKDDPATLAMWREAVVGKERESTDLHDDIMQSAR